MLQGREINLLFFIASTGDRTRVRCRAAPMLYTSAHVGAYYYENTVPI